jgi:maltose O-acetyltransferase
MSKLSRLLREEFAGLHPRLRLAQLLAAPLPIYVGNRWRTLLLRWAGFQIGPGTVIWGMPTITGGKDLRANLRIGRSCWLNAGCFIDAGAAVFIGDHVSIGQQALLITVSHALGDATRRAAAPTALPIMIGNGAWLGARCTILPGVEVGAGAVVAAGAVVTHNVPPHTLVGGVPARPIRQLDSSER